MRIEDIQEPIYREMAEYCLDHDITSYAGLMDYARENRSDWFMRLCNKGGCRLLVSYFKKQRLNNKK